MSLMPYVSNPLAVHSCAAERRTPPSSGKKGDRDNNKEDTSGNKQMHERTLTNVPLDA